MELIEVLINTQEIFHSYNCSIFSAAWIVLKLLASFSFPAPEACFSPTAASYKDFILPSIPAVPLFLCPALQKQRTHDIIMQTDRGFFVSLV